MVETGNKFHDNVGKRVAWAHWFTFFNIVALCLISLRYIIYSGLADTPLGIAYQFVSLVGHFSFLSAVAFIILLFPLAFIINNHLLYRLTSLLVATTAITFLIVDTQIFRLYQFHLNPFIWQFLQKPEQVEAIYSINLHYISIPITFSLELFFSYILWRKVRTIQSKQIGKPIALFLFTCFISSHLVFIWADATQYKPITHEKSLYPLSYPMTARTFLRKQGWLNEDIFEKNNVRVLGVGQKQLKYPLAPLTYSTQPTENINHNILIINIESLRADMLTKDNMPYLYSLSREGITFKNHFSGANNSQQGVFSLFYGLPNSYWNAVTDNQIPPVFMKKIKQQQRSIGLFSSIGFEQPEFVNSSFSDLKDSNHTFYSNAKSNNQVLQQWNQWLTEQENTAPWFSYIYLEQKNEQLFKQPTKTSIPAQAQNLALYQSQVMSIDKQIESLIEDLKLQQQYQQSIIIITGTHGQSFKTQSNNDLLISGASVPLVILWPNKEHKTIYSMTSHMDIIPTLMQDVFGVENKINDYSNGEYLFTKSNREYVLSGSINNYVIYENRKITKFSGNGDIEIIDWEGNRIKQSDDDDNFNITLLVDVLAKLRRFNQN
jgi:membrane-anchored protein YejM (alkaline phosphatase superfamily)